jgi:puromycin-sensitive aminopeptidase
MMQTWTRQMGYPVVSVRRDGGEFVLRQRRCLVSGVVDGPQWVVPLTGYGAPGGGDAFALMLEGAEARAAAARRVPPARARSLTPRQGRCVARPHMKLNVAQTGFYRVHYDDAALAAAVADSVAALPATDRFGVYSDAFALARARLVPLADVLRLLSHAASETTYIVAHSVICSLSDILRVFFDTLARGDLQAFGRKVLAPILARLGMTVLPDEPYHSTLLRSERAPRARALARRRR